MAMMFQGYAVANKAKPNMQRELIYFGELQTDDIDRINEYIASSFDYGHIKQGFETVEHLSERFFMRVVLGFFGPLGQQPVLTSRTSASLSFFG